MNYGDSLLNASNWRGGSQSFTLRVELHDQSLRRVQQLFAEFVDKRVSALRGRFDHHNIDNRMYVRNYMLNRQGVAVPRTRDLYR